MWIRALSIVCVLLAAAMVPPLIAPAHAQQIHRCTAADGIEIFTDRRCADVQAVDRRPRQGPQPALRSRYRGGCARNLQELVYEITSAIDTHDGNRLASVYHWPGMSSGQGYGAIARLDAIAQRPLVEIAPVMAQSPEGVDGDYYPQTSTRRPPVALRVHQSVGKAGTPAYTVFGLRRYLDCWWITG